ncbi:hypothetical protein ACFONN_14910 [Dyella humi]|uniref:Uncharacterized protein n=1 Tax=Dyella humi TaxID=1770547 RepID=A0ABW8INY7_9GAMM
MHEAAKRFSELPTTQRKAACLRLCEHALHVWEKSFPEDRTVSYQETVAGSIQTLDLELPRDALAAANAGADTASVASRYREPLVALQDEDVVLPKDAEFAYYAIHNAFERYALGRDIGEWIIVNQALSTAPDAIGLLTDVLREAG